MLEPSERDGALPHLADETESLAGDGSDQALLFAAVADRLAHRIDMAGQGRLGDDPPAPDRLQQIVLADDMIAVPHQMEQQSNTCGPIAIASEPRSAPAGRGRAHSLPNEKLHVVAPQNVFLEAFAATVLCTTMAAFDRSWLARPAVGQDERAATLGRMRAAGKP